LIRKGDAHSGLIRAFTLIGHEIPDAARGGYFRIEAHQYSGSVLGNLLNKELLPPRHDAEVHAANMAPLRNAWKLRQARLFIALATVRPYRHHRGADLGAELE
jgi:hypothetical protein